MSIGLPPTGGIGQAIPVLTVDPGPRGSAGRGRRGVTASRSEAGDEADGATGPPPEVVAEVREAARCAERLHELGRELRFERDAETGRIRAEVRDLDGNVLRTIPLAEVFDVARGAEVR